MIKLMWLFSKTAANGKVQHCLGLPVIIHEVHTKQYIFLRVLMTICVNYHHVAHMVWTPTLQLYSLEKQKKPTGLQVSRVI